MKYKIILLLVIIAFNLNFIWESFHAYYLYDTYKYDVPYFILMFYVSFVDAFLILFIFFFWKVIWKDFYWYTKLNNFKYLYIILLWSLIAIFIEIKWVYLLYEWSYSNLMPTFFGIWLSPLLQLSITSILSFISIKYIKI